MKALFLLPFLFLALAVVLLAADRPTNQHSIQRAMRRGKDATSAACCLHCFAVSHRHLLLPSTEAALWPLQGYPAV